MENEWVKGLVVSHHSARLDELKAQVVVYRWVFSPRMYDSMSWYNEVRIHIFLWAEVISFIVSKQNIIIGEKCDGY